MGRRTTTPVLPKTRARGGRTFTVEQVWRWGARTVCVGVVCPLIVAGTMWFAAFMRELDRTSTASLTELVQIRSDFRDWQARQQQAESEQRDYRRSVDQRFLDIAQQLTGVIDRLTLVEGNAKSSTRQFTGAP